MLNLVGRTINNPETPVYLNGVPYEYSRQPGKTYAVNHYLNGKMQRFEVRSGDRGYVDDAAHNNERAELVTYRPGAVSGIIGPTPDFGSDYWLSFDFMVEPGDEVLFPGSLTTRNGAVGQLHCFDDAGDSTGLSPWLLFQLDPGVDNLGYSVRTRFDKALQQTAPNFATFTDWYKTYLTRGQWIRNVLHFKPALDDTAVLDVWQNGVKVVEQTGINLAYGSTVGNIHAGYFAYGIYRTENANTLAVRYANVEQGTASLFDRVANPLSLPSF